MKVGFIGLGRMGAPMSSNVLAAGHELVVHDVRPDAAAGLLAAGAAWIDMSTSIPAVADKVRAVAGRGGVAVLDAPVAGGITGAGAGALQIFVGGG
jgi:3-hydroxyisobutyrate dehydrogenase